METRKARLIVNKSGSGNSTFRATLPNSWIREMGLDEENRNLILEYREDGIMIKKDEIFLVVTEDEKIVRGCDFEGETLGRDNVVYESDIISLVDIELDPNSHEEDIEDFDTELDFYLSNAVSEDYANYWLKTALDTVDLTTEARVIIQEEVVDRIKNKYKEELEKDLYDMILPK